MALFGQQGCKIGQNAELPYSGTTVVVNYCANSQHDDNNMVGGCTAIVTLSKVERYDQEKEVVTEGNTQYHILPLYKPAEVMSDDSFLEVAAQSESCNEVMGGIALDLMAVSSWRWQSMNSMTPPRFSIPTGRDPTGLGLSSTSTSISTCLSMVTGKSWKVMPLLSTGSTSNGYTRNLCQVLVRSTHWRRLVTSFQVISSVKQRRVWLGIPRTDMSQLIIQDLSLRNG